MKAAEMLLSIVVPSHNPEALFFSQMTALLRRQPLWQVIIVDDASTQEVRSFLPDLPNLTVLRNARPKGAGAARNRGLAEVRGSYTVFLDDDDFMDWSVIEALLAEMEAQPAVDMAFSAYQTLLDGKTRPMHLIDRRVLKKVLRGRDSAVVGLDGHEDLLRFTNYPWTKLYRTSFLRQIGLRFSETAVQNDVHAHWQSLLRATRILVTNRIQCTKWASAQGGRISNTDDNRRLQAFTALRETYELVQANGQPKVQTAFWTFYRDLVGWMLHVASSASRPLLMREHVRFAGVMPPDMRQIDTETGIKRWEIWDMNTGADMVPTAGTAKDTNPAPNSEQWQLCLSEISRLKHLAVELRAENIRLQDELRQKTSEAEQTLHRCGQDIEHLTREVTELRRHMNSKAMRMAVRLRGLYRSLLPARHEAPK